MAASIESARHLENEKTLQGPMTHCRKAEYLLNCELHL